jgi:hypothetical protein
VSHVPALVKREPCCEAAGVRRFGLSLLLLTVTTGAFIACQGGGDKTISDWPPRAGVGVGPISDWPAPRDGVTGVPGEEARVPSEADEQEEDDSPSPATPPSSDSQLGGALNAGSPATSAVEDAGAAEADTGTPDAGAVDEAADASTEASVDPPG